jgi:hypothetical protein
MPRDLSLAAQRFVVLKIKTKGRTRLLGERYVANCLANADALDAVLAKLKQAVTLLQRHLGVTREQAIEMLTPWARDDDGRSFEDRIMLALAEDGSWEPHKGRRLEVLQRVSGKSPGALDRALRRAKVRRRRTVQSS